MRRRSLLIVTYHYLPAETPGSRRIATVARLLGARGWDASILTATGSRGRRDARYRRDPYDAVALGEDGRAPAIASPAVSRIPLLRNFTRFPDSMRGGISRSRRRLSRSCAIVI
jgi:hypothetical protein